MGTRHGFALVSCLLAVAFPLQAGQVRNANLEELTLRANRIFEGRCVESKTVPHPQLGAVTKVTFQVDRAIKGDLAATLTIQTAIDALDVPRFFKGERVVLFLYGDSALGLTSPVALGQGKFSVLRDKHGNEIAVNALRNRNLLQGLSSAASERVGASLLQWDGKPDLPRQALLDGVEGLLRGGR